MSKYILFTKAFWADTAERTVATAAQAVAATWGADQVFPNALNLDYKVLAGVTAGGALAALVKQLAKLGITAQVPAPVETAKRSGGDVELRSPEQAPPANVEVAALPGYSDADAPVTDETVYND
jgi:hypothetical protein